jgi:hypothetical protein
VRVSLAPPVVAHAVDEVTSQVSRTSQLRMSEYPSENTSVADVICGMSLSEIVTVSTVPDTVIVSLGTVTVPPAQ